MNLRRNYSYFFFINEQDDYKNKIILYSIKFISLLAIFSIKILSLFTFINIIIFYPLRFNENISLIFTIGFLFISSLYFIVGFIGITAIIYNIIVYKTHRVIPIINLTNQLKNLIFEPQPNENEDFFCVICQQNYEETKDNPDYVKIPYCNHSFHFECIKNWLSIKQICPLCNQQINLSPT